MYKIILSDIDRTYICGEEDLLGSSLREGLSIPFGCKSGGCGMCKVKVESGEFTRGKCSKAVLSDEERKIGYTLACKTYPKTDLTFSLQPVMKKEEVG